MKDFTINNLNIQIQQLKEKNIISTEDISDGYHTFGQLYHDRAVLFAVILNTYKEKAWKSKQHVDGTMFDGMFIAGITTPQGYYTYHYDLEYWDIYDVEEVEKAPKWDGHTHEDINRLFGLINN